MKLNIEEIKIGDYVKVKKGTKAPDAEYQLMNNWQGEIGLSKSSSKDKITGHDLL